MLTPEYSVMSKLADRLMALDNKVLHLDTRRAELATDEGWARYVARWPRMVIAAAALSVLTLLLPLIDRTSIGAFAPLAAILAFHAGQLKGEHDRLQGRSMRDQALDQLNRMGTARRP